MTRTRRRSASVAVREQELRDGDAVGREDFLIRNHEPRLADGGAGLARGKLRGPLLQAERIEARSDRAAGDDDAFVAALHERGDFRREPAKLPQVEGVPPLRGENAGAEFENDALAFAGHDGPQGNGKSPRGGRFFRAGLQGRATQHDLRYCSPVKSAGMDWKSRRHARGFGRPDSMSARNWSGKRPRWFVEQSSAPPGASSATANRTSSPKFFSTVKTRPRSSRENVGGSRMMMSKRRCFFFKAPQPVGHVAEDEIVRGGVERVEFVVAAAPAEGSGARGRGSRSPRPPPRLRRRTRRCRRRC